ncbi:class E sortase [Kitasatospora viridis]|uniref:Sortase A n=1 Tax=Kitasatospora viridis TaxID=281105 RepID=A0A561UHG3_9ACTN|nr:class E sortase [Kitasatospora viridis]TWF98785.1 sortase A [Kitasatospora viridis]
MRPEGRQEEWYGGYQPYPPQQPQYPQQQPAQPQYQQQPAAQPGAESDGWGVYQQAEPTGYQTPEPVEPAPEYPWLADQTLQLRVVQLPGQRADDASAAPAAAAEGRRAQGRMSMRSGNGRRRAAGRQAPVVRPKERKRVVAARVLGELFITTGLVMLLFVAYQLWWTNVQADAIADGTRNKLEQQWNNPAAAPSGGPSGAASPTFAPGQGFAIIHVPKIGLTDPIAEGTVTTTVLDKGLVGHYTGTALPSDPAGNFAVAGHRTTHGQPFNRLAELHPGDKIVVETATTYYTYEVEGGIPETPPNNVSVLNPVPKGSPFTQPGRYITMTTCTPEYSARGRLIVFGKMIDERPRSQGQPPALTNS